MQIKEIQYSTRKERSNKTTESGQENFINSSNIFQNIFRIWNGAPELALFRVRCIEHEKSVFCTDSLKTDSYIKLMVNKL